MDGNGGCCTIEADRCSGCGLCVKVCPLDLIALNHDGRAMLKGRGALACDHCAAVCPAEAITVAGLDEEAVRLKTIATDDRWLPPGGVDAPALVRLMRSRRSCRNYLASPVAVDLLEDLVKIGITAPSGTNSQRWTFTILKNRSEVVALGSRIAAFFEQLNRRAANPFLRLGLRLLGRTALDRYYHHHLPSVAAALAAWHDEGRDLLFHGAPAAIIVGSRPGASCPQEDALLATQNILLAAHALGLGSCLIGYAVEAMRHDPTLKRSLGIPDSETVYAVIALGYADEPYRRMTGRKRPLVRFSGAESPGREQRDDRQVDQN